MLWTPVLHLPDQILVKHYTLTNIFDPYVFVITVNGGKLLFIQIDGRKPQNIVCKTCKRRASVPAVSRNGTTATSGKFW